MCGFGRTGKMFACEHWDTEPDIMTVAKNITACYAPLGAVMASDEAIEHLDMFMHVFTYTGHPVSCAAGLKNIEIMEREKLVENAAEIGPYLLDGLKTLEKHPIVGEVRGLGLLLGVELVKDKKTREPFGLFDGIADKITDGLLKQGIHIRSGGHSIEVAPVLTINKKEADMIVEALDKSVSEAVNELS